MNPFCICSCVYQQTFVTGQGDFLSNIDTDASSSVCIAVDYRNTTCIPSASPRFFYPLSFPLVLSYHILLSYLGGFAHVPIHDGEYGRFCIIGTLFYFLGEGGEGIFIFVYFYQHICVTQKDTIYRQSIIIKIIRTYMKKKTCHLVCHFVIFYLAYEEILEVFHMALGKYRRTRAPLGPTF